MKRGENARIVLMLIVLRLTTLGQTCILYYEQEAHGPHCSPEKTVQINKHI